MVEKKLEYEVGMNFSSAGLDKLEKTVIDLTNTINNLNNSLGVGVSKNAAKAGSSVSKISRLAQSGAARIGWGAASKPTTMGRTIGNILSKDFLELLPSRRLGKAGTKLGRRIGKSVGKSFGLKGAQLAGLAGKGAAAGGALGGALGMVVTLLPAFLALVVASSRMLQRTLGNIMKYLLMFLRPIGDMLAVIMYPLMMILRPLALMVNTIIRPFLMEARKSMRLSLQLSKQAKTARGLGMLDTATELDAASKDMMATGLATLGMGFSKVIVNISGELSKIIGGIFIDVVAFQMGNIATIIDALTGNIFNLKDTVASAATGAKSFVESNIDTAIKNFNEYADNFLETVKTKNEGVNTLASYTSKLLTNIATNGGDVKLFDTAISEMWKNLKTNGVDAISAIKTKAEELLNLTKPEASKTGKERVHEALMDFKTLPSENFNQNVSDINNANGVKTLGDTMMKTNDSTNVLGLAFSTISSLLNTAFKPQIDGLGTWFSSLGTQISTVISSIPSGFTGLMGVIGKVILQLGSLLINIMNLSNSMVYTINAMYSALAKAQSAANSAAASASRAASSASSASKSSGTSTSVKGTKAIGGSIDQNGIYYLHKGETVINPISSSFANSTGKEQSSAPAIEFNNCTFGGFTDWKKEMDKYFNTQMRHIR